MSKLVNFVSSIRKKLMIRVENFKLAQKIKRESGRSVNYFYRKSDSEVIAIRCNCDEESICYPFIKGIVYWEIKIRIPNEKIPVSGDLVYCEIKKKWVEEE